MSQDVFLSGRERTFPEDEIIVSKTDPKGRITYANDIFIEVSGYTENELLGQPHSIVRHPQMPRCVFKLLWDTIQAGEEIFAYVNNRAKNGDNYWVFAHITPWFGEKGDVAGYHSFRRSPRRNALTAIEPVYRTLLETESRHADRKKGIEQSVAVLNKLLADNGLSYAQFVLGL